jgi:hypothetical protein
MQTEKIEYLLNNCHFEEAMEYKNPELFIQLFCSNCDGVFCEAGCCSQSRNIVKRPIKLLTENDIINIKTSVDGTYVEDAPFDFVSLSDFLEDPSWYDYDLRVKPDSEKEKEDD